MYSLASNNPIFATFLVCFLVLVNLSYVVLSSATFLHCMQSKNITGKKNMMDMITNIQAIKLMIHCQSVSSILNSSENIQP